MENKRLESRSIDQKSSEIDYHLGAVVRPRPVWPRLIRFGFRLLYNEMAFTYDSVSWLVSLGQWRDWQRAALPFIKGPVVLEIAPGPGHMMLALDREGHHVFGLELSPFMVQIASDRMTRNHSNALVIQGQAEHVPFTDGTFTSVLVTFPGEFIFSSETLNGIYRSLVNGGSLVIVLGAQLGGNGITSRLIRMLYKITGQDYAQDASDIQAFLMSSLTGQIDGLRFQYDFKQLLVRGSLVTLLILEKRNVENN